MPIVSRFSEKVKEGNPVHPEKAYSPIDLTFERSTDEREEQFLKAEEPILVTSALKVTVLRLVAPQHTYAGIEVTFSPKTISVKLILPLKGA